MNQFLAWNECEELTHSQQQPQVNSQVDYQNDNALGPPKVSPLQDLGLSSGQVKTHTQQSTSST